MPRSKAKKTGSRTRGRGHKKGRGAGLRGGRGNAGSHKTKRVMYERVGRIWGRYGFKRPQSTVKASRVTNIREIEENLEMMIKEGIVKKKGDVITVPLLEIGYDKLLSYGAPSKAYRIVVPSASARAIEKMPSAGGEIVNE